MRLLKMKFNANNMLDYFVKRIRDKKIIHNSQEWTWHIFNSDSSLEEKLNSRAFAKYFLEENYFDYLKNLDIPILLGKRKIINEI